MICVGHVRRFLLRNPIPAAAAAARAAGSALADIMDVSGEVCAFSR